MNAHSVSRAGENGTRSWPARLSRNDREIPYSFPWPRTHIVLSSQLPWGTEEFRVHVNVRRLSVMPICAVGVAALVIAGATPAHSDSGCPGSLVPRNARPGDTVCVTPQVAADVAAENANPDNNRQPGGGAYGPQTCKSGYVWREAFVGDSACVTPDRRTESKNENTTAPSGTPVVTTPNVTTTPISSSAGPSPITCPDGTILQPGHFCPTPGAIPPAVSPQQGPPPRPNICPDGSVVPQGQYCPTPTNTPTTLITTTPRATPTTSVPPTTSTAPSKPPACNPQVDICVH